MLKYVIALIVISPLAHAVNFPPVEALCSGPKCTEQMRAIVQDYQNSNEFFAPEEIPQAVSGSCYHIHPNLDEKTEHFALFLIDQSADGPTFNGKFLFFYKENPYKGISVEKARTELSQSPPHAVEVANNEGHGVISTDSTNLFYYFRVNHALKEFYLLSLWQLSGSSSPRIFCRMNYE